MIYRLYIGADNNTGRVDRDRIVKRAGQAFDGFTVVPAMGYWQGQREQSLIVEIETSKAAAVNKLARDLKKDLKQDAIGISKTSSMKFI